MSGYISPSRLAEEKGVSRQAVHLAIRRGILTFFGDGRSILVTRESADAWEPDRRRQENGRVRNG